MSISQKIESAWIARVNGDLLSAHKYYDDICNLLSVNGNDLTTASVKELDPPAKQELLSLIALGSSLARANKNANSSEGLINHIKNNFSTYEQSSNFHYCFEQASCFFKLGQYIEALKYYEKGLPLAPKPIFKVDCLLGCLLVQENLGLNSKNKVTELDELLLSLDTTSKEYASRKQQLRAYWQRSLFADGQIVKAQELGKNDDGSVWQNGYFSALMSEYPFTKVSDGAFKEFILNMPADGYLPDRDFRIRTLTGISSAEDLNYSQFHLVGRLYLWLWKWMQDPLGFSFSKVLSLLKAVDCRFTTNTTKNSHLLANVFVWLSVWDHKNRRFLLQLADEVRLDGVQNYPLYDLEQKLAKSFINHSTEGRNHLESELKKFEDMYFYELLSESSMPSAELVKLKSSLASLLRNPNVNVEDKIHVDLFSHAVTSKEGVMVSEYLALAFKTLSNKGAITFDEFVAEVFNYSSYEEAAHKPKIYNLLTRMKSLLPSTSSITTSEGTILSSGLRDVVSLYGERCAEYNLYNTLGWKEFIEQLKGQKLAKSLSLKATMMNYPIKAIDAYQGEFLTGREIQNLLGVPKTTALRKINDLMVESKLKKVGVGKGTRYLVL